MPEKAFESKDYRLLSSVSAQAILPQMAVHHQTFPSNLRAGCRTLVFADIAGVSDMAALLRMKAAFTNFDQVVRTADSLWNPSLPVCASWQGVTCWPDGAVNTVTFSIPALAPPNSFPAAPADVNVSSAHASVSHQLAGTHSGNLAQK